MAASIRRGERRESDDASAILAAAARGTLPENPEALKRATVAAAATAPLSDLRQAIDVLRDREASLTPAARGGWTLARAAVHAALARRGSRLAVFDLRETLVEAGVTVPVEFVAALAAVGDASCLEVIAAAFELASRGEGRDEWWRRHLVDAFQAIVARERLTRRHAVIKRIEKRWPAAARTLSANPARQ
jgi:phosphoserine phosphatase